MPRGVVIPVLEYADVASAAAWLCDAFGFAERLRIGNHRVQLSVDEGSVVVAEPKNVGTPNGHTIMVRVRDADAHAANARRAGARIIHEPETYQFGERQYTAEDVGGHRWTFTQTVADSDPATWGGVLVGE
jgi:uncharacterized glyoxalase superfamily protein PhnB